MAESPPLPISTPHAHTAPATPPIATFAFRAFISSLSSSLRQGFSDRRPWSELLDRSSISRPESLSDAYSRIRKNASYFRVNYVTLIALALALSLVTHPFSLLVLLSLLAAWSILYLFRPSDQPLFLFGRTFSDRETVTALVVLTVFVVFVTSVGALLISSLTVGLAVVCLHGAFRVPEDLFLDDLEPRNAGLLSFLAGGPAGSRL
ncbi:PRA1 family protein B3-like [Arachis stenosperma]|uniref:PRA1 family protein B3-like n=1 Tax=Arachis stenosperma TaxID=217475 RepID=UPI0025AC5784|nr:PRA1 family protein B3-like [Arachis stenosperma]